MHVLSHVSRCIPSPAPCYEPSAQERGRLFRPFFDGSPRKTLSQVQRFVHAIQPWNAIFRRLRVKVCAPCPRFPPSFCAYCSALF